MATPQMITIVGQGPILMGTFDATNGQASSGYLTNLKKIGAGNKTLKIALARETGTIKESDSGQMGTLKKFNKGKTATITLDMAQFTRSELALAMHGTSLTRAASTVSAERLPQLAVGDYFVLKHPGVSSVVVEDSTGSPVTLVQGTHYSVDSDDHGTGKIISLTGLTQPLFADYSYGAYAQITALNTASARRGIVFKGVNVSEGNIPVRVIVPLVDFDPAKDFNWMGTEESSLTLEGEILYCSELADDTDFGAYFRVDALPADA